MASQYDAVDSEDVVVNALRAVKTFVPDRMEKVKKAKVYAEDAPKTEKEKQEIYRQGYLKALTDVNTFIKNTGV